jgi:adenosylcobinamide kinase/adenosylcobinamide-phosphate guanylyltransferase
MGKIILVLGGVRSGKSHHAVELAKQINKRTVFLATMEFIDEETKERIKLHKQSRPQEWQTVEEGKNVDKILFNLKGLCDIVIIDCLTNLVSNLLLELNAIGKVKDRVKEIITILKDIDFTVIIVSNEVGCGVVPGTSLDRDFRDIAGLANQLMAKHADEVYLMTAGIPILLKPQINTDRH